MFWGGKKGEIGVGWGGVRWKEVLVMVFVHLGGLYSPGQGEVRGEVAEGRAGLPGQDVVAVHAVG